VFTTDESHVKIQAVDPDDKKLAFLVTLTPSRRLSSPRLIEDGAWIDRRAWQGRDGGYGGHVEDQVQVEALEIRWKAAKDLLRILRRVVAGKSGSGGQGGPAKVVTRLETIDYNGSTDIWADHCGHRQAPAGLAPSTITKDWVFATELSWTGNPLFSCGFLGFWPQGRRCRRSDY
jgi:hypothetical protein